MAAWTDTDGARRRHQPRAALRLDCILTRRKGSPIACHTLDVGPGGMRIQTNRPLSVDELLHFDLGVDGGRLDGDARVLRAYSPSVYALRIETLAADAASHLGALATG